MRSKTYGSFSGKANLQDDSAASFVIEIEHRVHAEDVAEQMERGVVVIEDKGEASSRAGVMGPPIQALFSVRKLVSSARYS